MKSIILFGMLTSYSAFCFGQTGNTSKASMDSIIASHTDTAPIKSTLTVGAVYANNASYYGQKPEGNTSYIAIAASYKFKSGFYLSGMAYKLLNEKTSSVSASSVAAGVNFKLAKKLSADLSYTHAFYPAYSPMLQAANAENASVELAYENSVHISHKGDYDFGKTNDEFVTAAISKSINLFSIGKKDVVTINPSADISAGTQRFYQTYLTEKKLRDSLLGIILNPITGNPSEGNSNTVSSTSFNVLSYNFKLPLAYNRCHYLVEAAYQLSVLSSKVQSDQRKANSFVTLSFYYQF